MAAGPRLAELNLNGGQNYGDNVLWTDEMMDQDGQNQTDQNKQEETGSHL